MTDSTEDHDTSLWSRDFTLLLLANFFLCLGIDMLMPVLPVYLSQAGGNNIQVGVVMGCFTLSAIAIRVFAAKITAHLGSRVFLMTGLIFTAVIAGGYYLTSAIMLLFFLRILHGFGFGTTSTLYGAIVSNIIPRSRMGEGMGYFGMGIVVATAIGPFFGAVIVQGPDYKWVFLLSSGLIFIAAFMTRLTKAGGENDGEPQAKTGKIKISDFLEKKALVPAVLIFFAGISLSGMFTFIMLFGKEAGIKGIGVFFLVTSISEMLIRTIAGRLYDRRGHFVVLIPGALAGFTGTVLLALSRNLILLTAASIFYGISMGMLFPVLQAWSVKSVEPARRVAATATFFSFLDCGIAIGSIILGMIAQATNFASMYMYSSLVFVMFLSVYAVYYFRKKSR
jgi:MFS family permease